MIIISATMHDVRTNAHTHTHTQVDTASLDGMALMGGSGFEPFQAMVPGGKDGEVYDNMTDYFYLAQLRAQGEVSPTTTPPPPPHTHCTTQ